MRDKAATVDNRIAARLRGLRHERSWSLDALAERSGVSRATLSRLENGDVSPTAAVLGRLCAAHGLTMSRLLAMVESDFVPLFANKAQPQWRDPETGYVRRSVSPPADTLNAEVLKCEIPPSTRIDYPDTPRPGLEHHLVMLEGGLAVTVDGEVYRLTAGDCLRYRLFGPSTLETDAETAHYMLVIV